MAVPSCTIIYYFTLPSHLLPVCLYHSQLHKYFSSVGNPVSYKLLLLLFFLHLPDAELTVYIEKHHTVSRCGHSRQFLTTCRVNKKCMVPIELEFSFCWSRCQRMLILAATSLCIDNLVLCTTVVY